MSIATRRTAVCMLLLDGEWHRTMEICAVDVGGSEGCRRLRALRKDVRAGKMEGFNDIVKRPVGGDSSQWEYKLLEEPVKLTPKDETLSLFASEDDLL